MWPSPAISIDQKSTSRNPRSTVGTVTEIYDYLRLLYARIGKPHCPVCGRPIAGQSIEAIVDSVLALPYGRSSRSTRRSCATARASSRILQSLRDEGFTRVKVDGEQRLLDEEIELDKKFKRPIDVVVDRLVMKPDLRHRLGGLVETALALPIGSSRSTSWTVTMTFSERFTCPRARRRPPRARAARVLVQSAARRVPALHRPRPSAGDRSRPAVPDPTLSIGGGASALSVGGSSFYEGVSQAIADHMEPISTPRGASSPRSSSARSYTGRTATASMCSTATAWAEGART